MNPPPTDTDLYVLRRMGGGYGGAELVVQRFGRMFGDTYHVTAISEQTLGLRSGLADRLLPKWWRPIQYARRVDRYLHAAKSGIVLSLERGPSCTIYRAGDGAHRRWLEIKGGMWNWCNPLHWIMPRLERRSVTDAAVVVANSKMVRRDLERFHPECDGKIRVIHNGVELTRFCWSDEDQQKVRGRLGWKHGGEHWLFVGSGWARKGLAIAIQLMSRRLHRAEPEGKSPPTLHVVGRGRPERYRSMAVKNGVSSAVVFHGPQEDLQDWYHAADVLVLPTAYDPCSNATLEALASGCPVITTNTNGAAEAITISEAGVVIDAACPDLDLVDAWLDESLEWDARRHIAESMASWTQDREREAYEALFEELRGQ